MIADALDSSELWSSAREEMVAQQIEARGVTDAGVLDAMRRLPRELFVPAEYGQDAYADKALPLAFGATISQPYIVAAMTEALQVRSGLKVLEVGTGSGYQSALLALLGGRVYAIERVAELHEAARRLTQSLAASRADLAPLGGITFRVGDGSIGWPEEAPFDRIIVTAGAPGIPQTLLAQVRPGGIMVLPVGPPESQTLVAVEQRDGRTVERCMMGCRFVPLVGSAGWREESAAPANGGGELRESKSE